MEKTPNGNNTVAKICCGNNTPGKNPEMGVFFPMRQISVIFPGGFFPNFLFLKLKIKKKKRATKTI